MKMQSILVLLMLAVMARPVDAEELTENSLASFKFNGVPLGTTLEVTQKRFPRMVVDKKNLNLNAGVKTYFVLGANESYGAFLRFHNDKLFRVEIVYTSDRVNDIGGLEAVTKKFLAQFGPEIEVNHHVTGTRLTWKQIDRRADLAVMPAGMSFTVTDTVVETAVNQSKAQNADLGF